LPNILIVDDSPAVRRSLRALLEGRSDWQVCGEAENGREGVDKALQLSPNLIVLDLSMPVMNGLQAARELRRLMPQVPVLLFTTFCNSVIEQEALASGVRAVRSKADGIESLCQSIQDLLSAGPASSATMAS
jgi:two-component system, chemotaxis family, chemotaxis protein CheY